MVNIYFDNCEAEDFRSGEGFRHHNESWIITRVRWVTHGVWITIERN